MTSTQDTLEKATNEYVEAADALSALWAQAAQRTLTDTEIRPYIERADATRKAYAEALTAAGHSVPHGLV
ncbi:hypothetical protein ACFY3G_35030 [Streptomyces phaeochromogenes]|uniref:hypothetical protein n=1 Tax=Streptomyces phaeochromogenes TaxID=1923 RepID=UPI0036B3F691